MKRRIRFKVIALVFAIGFLPLLVGMSITVYRLRNLQAANAVIAEKQLAKTISREIESFVVSQFTYLQTTAFTVSQLPADLLLADSLLERALFRNDNFTEIAITGPEGQELGKKNIARIVTPDDLIDRSGSPEFEQVRREGAYVGPVYLYNGRPQFLIGSAIFDAKKLFIGATFAVVDARVMQSVVSRVSASQENSRAYIVNDKGVVIAHPELSFVLKEADFSHIPSVRRFVYNDPAVNPSAPYFNEFNQSVLGAGTGITLDFILERSFLTDWFVITETPAAIALAEVSRITQFSLIILLIVLTSAGIVAFIFADRLVRPIELLSVASQKFGQGDLRYRVQVKTNDEIEDLAHRFNTMADDLSKSISDLTREREVISAERNKLQLVISGITDAVIAVDLKRRIVLFNKAAEALTNIRTEEALGKPITDIIRVFENKREIPILEYCPTQTKGFEGMAYSKQALKILDHKGSEHYAHLVAGQIREGKNIDLGCIITLHDITREELFERVKSEFVSIAAHQLRTPLTGIKWATEELLEPTHAAAPQKIRDLFQKIHRRTEGMIELVNNLLNVAKIEEGRQLYTPGQTNIDELLAATIEIERPGAERKSIAIEYQKSAIPLPSVMADEQGLRLVFQNLINNAVRYTDAGGKVIIATEQLNKKTIQIRLKDSGMGMSQNEKGRVFTKFFRGETATRMETEGSGLGLFIVKNIIETHGESIDRRASGGTLLKNQFLCYDAGVDSCLLWMKALGSLL
jgi:PAS domain S-box-containing protein